DGRVDVAAVAREPPDDPAVDAALADARLPDELAAPSRVEPVDDTRLLADEQPLDAVRQTLEHGGCADVVVHPGATGGAAAIARQIELVTRCELLRPRDGAVGDLERDDRVTHRRLTRVVVARRDVQKASRRIERRRRPRACARRAPLAAALRVRRAGLRCFG